MEWRVLVKPGVHMEEPRINGVVWSWILFVEVMR
jgi:hypothetical protein